MRQGRLLILNENEELLECKNFPYEIIRDTFSNSKNYLSIFPSLIIININSLKDRDIVKHFRENKLYSHIIIVCIVKSTEKISPKELVKDGVDYCVNYPFDREEFWLKIKNIMSRIEGLKKQYLLKFIPHFPPISPKIKITSREKDILILLSKGYSNIEIAKTLYLSQLTVKTHLKNLFKKLHATNRTEALIISLAYNIISNNTEDNQGNC